MIKIPFHRNPNFVGRADILDAMKRAVDEDRSVGARIALVGIGGMGKTQLMLQYCYEHLKEYTHVFWLRADGTTTILEEFRRLAEMLDIKVDNAKGDKEDAIVARVLQWFESRQGWLLLLDDIDEIQDIAKFMPRRGGGGNI